MSDYRPNNPLFPPVIKNLVIINFLCWLVTIVAERYGFDLVKYGGLHYWRSEDFNIAQFITYMFMHDTSSLSHVLFNMFGLWMFGKDIENYWGAKRTLTFYFATGIGAGIMQQITWAIDIYPIMNTINGVLAGGDVSALGRYFDLSSVRGAISAGDLLELKMAIYNARVTVGASGAVFGFLLAFAMLFPNARIFIFLIPIPIRAPFFVLMYALLELWQGVSHVQGDNVAHFAHLGGMIFGLALILYWKKKDKASGGSTYTF